MQRERENVFMSPGNAVCCLVPMDLVEFWKFLSLCVLEKHQCLKLSGAGGKPLPHSCAVRPEKAQCGVTAGSEVVLTYVSRQSPGYQHLIAHLPKKQ